MLFNCKNMKVQKREQIIDYKSHRMLQETSVEKIFDITEQEANGNK